MIWRALHRTRTAASLACLVVVSALVLVGSTHYCRVQYAELKRLEDRQWALQEDHSRLLLEHSTWAAPHRVHRLAQEELRMAAPALDRYQVVGQ
jgi:cell division protein FtsL